MTDYTTSSLILSGISVVFIPSLGWWLTRLIKTKDELTAKNLMLWQEGAKERHESLVSQINDLDVCMQDVKKAVRRKVETEDCLRLSKEKWDRINKHSHDTKGRVVIPR